MIHWNDDKPHRCPNCHRVWNWDFRLDHFLSWRWGGYTRHEHYMFHRHWWRVNKCEYCGCRFAGWGREEA
ncbi:hypothetical protein SEA_WILLIAMBOONE_154 [Gordonia phage WilliamBoone]|nr:hypothetical protein SEA_WILLIAMBOONE_154 [Gordonia phage WilliamBoone]